MMSYAKVWKNNLKWSCIHQKGQFECNEKVLVYKMGAHIKKIFQLNKTTNDTPIWEH